MRIGTHRSEDNRRLTRRQNEGATLIVEREEVLVAMTPRPPQRSLGGELPTPPSAGTSGDGGVEEPGRPLAAFGEIAHGDLDELEEMGQRPAVDRRTDLGHRGGMERHAGIGQRFGHLAGDLGVGLAAGLIGTAVMTVGQRIEMRRTGRQASTAPADAVEKVFGVTPPDRRAKERLAEVVHYSYGTAWGGVRALLAHAGMGRVGGSLAHFAAIWGAAAAMLPLLGLAPPPTRWSRKQVLVDGMHHAVYAAATGAAYSLLRRRR